MAYEYLSYDPYTGQYYPRRTLGDIYYQNWYQQPQQQNQQGGMNPLQAYDMYTKFSGGGASGAGASGGATVGVESGAVSGGSSSGMGGLGAAGWGALAALIAAKMEDSRKANDISYSDQAKNPSRNIMADMDRWEVDQKLENVFGGDIGGGLSSHMRGALDFGSGDFSNAWKHFKEGDPILKALGKIF